MDRQRAEEARRRLEALPRIGWLEGVRDGGAPTRDARGSAPLPPVSPLERHEALGRELGLGQLWLKRDDCIPALLGSTKVRKLEWLLAASPWREAPAWWSAGSIASGHLATACAAGHALHTPVHAVCFWVPPPPDLDATLGFVATHAASLRYASTRAAVAVRWPWVFAARSRRGAAVVPPGATCAVGTLGTVHAALELLAQCEARGVEPPHCVYVALGSGGTAVGLALGFALAGAPVRVRAVATVEAWASSRWRLARIARATWAELRNRGVVTGDMPALRLEVVRGQLGQGYGHSTSAGEHALRLFAAHGVSLEPTYTAKTAAALVADARARGDEGPVLFWVTASRPDALPPPPDGWQERLPPALRRRLEAQRGAPTGSPHPAPSAPATAPARWTRRRALVAGGLALGAGGALLVRADWYPQWPGGWHGRALPTWAAHVLCAAAEVVLPPVASEADARRAVVAADALVAHWPPAKRRLLLAGLVVAEHVAPLLAGRWRRWTRLERRARAHVLTALRNRGGRTVALYDALRLVPLLGFYQGEAAWRAIGYEGPPPPPPVARTYAEWVASPGEAPRGWRRV